MYRYGDGVLPKETRIRSYRSLQRPFPSEDARQLFHAFPNFSLGRKGKAEPDVVGGLIRDGGPIRARIECDALLQGRACQVA